MLKGAFLLATYPWSSQHCPGLKTVCNFCIYTQLLSCTRKFYKTWAAKQFGYILSRFLAT